MSHQRSKDGKREFHGLYNEYPAEYRIWSSMKTRCYNRRHRWYHNYGGRGITVCDRWRASFANFLADMGTRPFVGVTLDRKENDEPYSPDNCLWSTRTVQARNRRSSRLLTVDGQTKTLAEWCEIYGMCHATIWRRIEVFGWSVDLAVKTPPLGVGRKKSNP